jgi:hypothetical protein
MSDYSDYLVEVYRTNVVAGHADVECVFEKHVGLTAGDRNVLEEALGLMQEEGKITDYTIEKVEPEYWTLGFAETLSAIEEALSE